MVLLLEVGRAREGGAGNWLSTSGRSDLPAACSQPARDL